MRSISICRGCKHFVTMLQHAGAAGCLLTGMKIGDTSDGNGCVKYIPQKADGEAIRTFENWELPNGCPRSKRQITVVETLRKLREL